MEDFIKMICIVFGMLLLWIAFLLSAVFDLHFPNDIVLPIPTVIIGMILFSIALKKILEKLTK